MGELEKELIVLLQSKGIRPIANRIHQLQTDRNALVRYLRLLFPVVNPILHLAQIRGGKIDLKEAHEAYQGVSQETRDEIEEFTGE